jgi:hypothetical protein
MMREEQPACQFVELADGLSLPFDSRTGYSEVIPLAWFVPAQTVDAKPASQLIRQHFPLWRTDLSGCTQSDPGQDGVPFESTLADDA